MRAFIAPGLMAAIIGCAGCAKVGQRGERTADGGGADTSSESHPQPLPEPTVDFRPQQVKCDPRPPTSVSGTVFAPNGTFPLFNVIVFVPNARLDPFPAGVSCDRCGMIASGKPIATTVSDSQGTFKIINVPAGSNIPLVFQLGKWRREIILPTVTACQDNPITDANLTRLPRNRQEGELPRIAVTTGVCDQVGCLLPRLGIDLAELGVAGDDKAVAFYQQVGVPDPSTTAKPPPDPFGPPNMRKSTELWNDEAELGRYDMTLLSSECGKALYNKSDAAFAAMTNYLAKGGRILSTDLSYVWLRYSPDPALAAVGVPNLGGPGDSPMILDTSFPKAKALADWMKFVDPAVTYGQISSDRIFNNVESVMPTSARTWASSPTTWKPCQSGTCPRIITVNTPVGVPASNQCGRALHLDFQVTNIVTSSNEPGATFPQNCGAADLGKNEEIAAFLFFDLASCIQDDLLPIVTP